MIGASFYEIPQTKIREVRTRLGITGKELATTLGVSHQAIYLIEGCKRHVSLSMLYEIAKALNVPPIDLLPDDWKKRNSSKPRSSSIQKKIAVIKP